MSALDHDLAQALQSHALAGEQLGPGTCHATLHLGGDASVLLWGRDREPDAVATLKLGLSPLAETHFRQWPWSEGTIEAAITEVEDAVMPWLAQVPARVPLFSGSAGVAAVAEQAGMPADSARWLLSTEAVEQLFNRWSALALGRPASQDSLPTTAVFSAALLLLRECLHHGAFEGVTLVRHPHQPWAQPPAAATTGITQGITNC